MNRGSRKPSRDAAETIVCDKTDRAAFAKVLRKQPWDVIVDTILNADDLEFVVETLGRNVGHFIHTGSLGVYGEARQIPATEDQALSAYQGSEYVMFNHKLEQDQILMRAFNEKAFPATILRKSYIYGPGDILLDA
ncbi:MAG: NAD-dependent epimerase/dehydratase family protein [Chthoniobacterales bacterium]